MENVPTELRCHYMQQPCEQMVEHQLDWISDWWAAQRVRATKPQLLLNFKVTD